MILHRFPLHRVLAAGSCAVLFGILSFAQSPNLSPRDKAFLKMAAVTNMTEAHLGEMAESMAAKSGIKDFGQTLAKDHTRAYEQLAVLDSQLGQPIPKGINARRDQEIERLNGLKGRRFDAQFLRDEVQDHERAVRAFRREAEHGSDQQVKAYASQVLPIVEEHLREAEKLLKSRA
jgi:putative membrane protein